MTGEESVTGPYLSKIGIVAVVVLVASVVALGVGLTQPWISWTPEGGEEQTAGFYELDSPQFLGDIGDTDYYLQEGAFNAMLALVVASIAAFGLLAYEAYGEDRGPASLRSGIAATVFVLFGTGAAASANRFIAETSAMSHNYTVEASTLAGIFVALAAGIVVALGLLLFYFAASHRFAERARYDKRSQRILTGVLVGLLAISSVGYAAVSFAPWTEIRGEFTVEMVDDAPGSGAFEASNADSFQVTEHFLLHATSPKPLFEMRKDIQLVSAASLAGLLASLGGLVGLTHLRNRGDSEGSQLLMLVGAGVVVAGVAAMFGLLNFHGHANELATFLQTSAGGQSTTIDVTVAGLTNYFVLATGVVLLGFGGYYALRVLPVSGQVVRQPPAPSASTTDGGSPGGTGQTVETTPIETDDDTVVETAEGGKPTDPAGASATTRAETLSELDQRLIEGEISEDTYWDLRNRL